MFGAFKKPPIRRFIVGKYPLTETGVVAAVIKKYEVRIRCRTGRIDDRDFMLMADPEILQDLREIVNLGQGDIRGCGPAVTKNPVHS